ncbi:MAG: hypothetical protein A4E54_02830 [Pelotomaculum sp. PtaB.Bin117]|nr:MAG: hypothetical protein A4E54_02830 [Pelotomaculum sp. PtaB.Bin117]
MLLDRVYALMVKFNLTVLSVFKERLKPSSYYLRHSHLRLDGCGTFHSATMCFCCSTSFVRCHR